MYAARRRRDEIFDIPGLFGDPAWDMLLDLLTNEDRLHRVSVSSACIAACVPQTTALRWLSTLEDYGLIERIKDLADGRRTFVKLTRTGRNMVCEALRAGVHANPTGCNAPIVLSI